ncbi:unnamed protein product [Brassica oleracea]|uniref:(rape) hypothetical protein n=1 Tax=Brassica napus TaxID=3708 RepID=A0A816L8R3_BRANA|nr:unnamed protein product [Brassica napus]
MDPLRLELDFFFLVFLELHHTHDIATASPPVSLSLSPTLCSTTNLRILSYDVTGPSTASSSTAAAIVVHSKLPVS